MVKYQNRDFIKNVATGDAKQHLLRRAINEQGAETTLPIFYRFVVLDVITDPLTLVRATEEEKRKKIEYWNSLGYSGSDNDLLNAPRNTVIGVRMNDATASQNEEPMLLYPFFPSHLALPCKPGEHVWVMFEARVTKMIGYWFCRVNDFSHVDDVNHSHSPRSLDQTFFQGTTGLSRGTEPDYSLRVGKPLQATNGEAYTSAITAMVNTDDEEFYEKLVTDSDAAKAMTYEAIPRFRKRPGDISFEGSNNTLIVLGTDRTGPYAETSIDDLDPKKIKNDMEKNAGAIDIVAGRGQTPATMGKVVNTKKISDRSKLHEEIGKGPQEVNENEGNPDWINDKSRVLVAQRTKVDTNLGLKDFNAEFGITEEEDGDGAGAVVVKSDKVRIVARKDVELIVEGVNGNAAIIIKSNGDIIFRPSKEGYIKLGGDDANLAVLCNTSVPGSPGTVQSTPIIDTMGGSQGQGGAAGQFATKVLLK
jgi:hypothetical protein